MTARFAQLDGALGPWRPFRYDVAARLREPKWIVESLLAEEMILLLSGDSSAGKSYVSLALAMAVLDGGRHWLGLPVAGPGRVLVVEGEMTAYDVEKRLRGFGLRDEHWDRLVYLDKSQAVALDDTRQVEQLLAVRDAFKPDLIVLDSVFSAAPTIDHNSNGAVSAFYRDTLRRLAASSSLLLLHHETKPGDHGRGRSEYAATGARAWAHQADRHLTLAAKGDKEVSLETLPDGRVRRTYAIELDSGKARTALKPRLELVIETVDDADGNTLSTDVRVVGERQRRNRSDRSDRIVAALGEQGPKRRKDLADACGGEGGSFDRALRALCDSGSVMRDGERFRLA
jgi:hypothetical protein